MAYPIITGRGLHVPGDSLSNGDLASVIDPDRLAAWVARNEWSRRRLAELSAADGVRTSVGALERRVFADYVEQRIGIRTRRGVDRTAILERRASRSGLFASDLGARAAQRALDAAGVGADQVDVVICGTSSPDRVYPTTAIEIQHRIGAERAHAYDLLAACSSFVYGLEVARGLLMAAVARRVLVVAAEYFTGGVDYRDPETAFFWGDGAAAVVIEAPELGRGKGGYEIVDTLCRSRLSDNIRTGLGGTRPLVADGALGPWQAGVRRAREPRLPTLLPERSGGVPRGGAVRRAAHARDPRAQHVLARRGPGLHVPPGQSPDPRRHRAAPPGIGGGGAAESRSISIASATPAAAASASAWRKSARCSGARSPA